MNDIEQNIKDYWEDPNTRSLIDVNLRKLEEGVVLPYLEPNQEVIDIGCGGGESTVIYGAKVKRCLGLERSDYLRQQAETRIATAQLQQTSIVAGEVAHLEAYQASFDLAITQRCLINLTSWKQQKQAIDNIRATLRPGGIYVMIENTFEGHDAVNAFREKLGLKKVSRHWHNLFFHHDDLMDYLLDGRFRLIKHHTFDLYYLLTRVYVNLFASFEGFGKNAQKDAIFEQADLAARQLYETFGESIKFGDGPSFGPIQGFVLRRVD